MCVCARLGACQCVPAYIEYQLKRSIPSTVAPHLPACLPVCMPACERSATYQATRRKHVVNTCVCTAVALPGAVCLSNYCPHLTLPGGQQPGPCSAVWVDPATRQPVTCVSGGSGATALSATTASTDAAEAPCTCPLDRNPVREGGRKGMGIFLLLVACHLACQLVSWEPRAAVRSSW